jgi:hypothetical protein
VDQVHRLIIRGPQRVPPFGWWKIVVEEDHQQSPPLTKMPTVHYVSRETFRKHDIGHIPWELMNKKHRVTTTNDASDVANVKVK